MLSVSEVGTIYVVCSDVASSRSADFLAENHKIELLRKFGRYGVTIVTTIMIPFGTLVKLRTSRRPTERQQYYTTIILTRLRHSQCLSVVARAFAITDNGYQFFIFTSDSIDIVFL